MSEHQVHCVAHVEYPAAPLWEEVLCVVCDEFLADDDYQTIFRGWCKRCVSDEMRRRTRLAVTTGNKHASSRTHCANGHEYIDGSFRIWRDKRICRICEREAAKRYHDRLREKYGTGEAGRIRRDIERLVRRLAKLEAA